MKTKKIFDTDAYIIENKARVLKCTPSEREDYKGLFEVICDSTVFSPEGGGQKADEGFFNDIKVKDVQEIEGEIIHFLEKEVEAGSEVNQSIDFELRKRRMQVHNAEHLICGIIHKRYGYSNVGFHVSESYEEGKLVKVEAVMDVDGVIEPEDLADIEKEANKAIEENVKIFALLPDKEEAKNIDYRSKLDIEENLRLVVIEGYDTCACCAPCLKASGEIGLVKIVDFMVHRQGMRLTLVAGLDAFCDYVGLHDQNKEIMKVLSAKRDECASSVMSQAERLNKAHEEIIGLKKSITELYSISLAQRIDDAKGDYLVFFADSLDEVQARTLINENVAKKDLIILILFDKNENGYKFVAGKNDSVSVSLKDLAAKMREGLSARGGGSEKMIQGSIESDRESIQNFFK